MTLTLKLFALLLAACAVAAAQVPSDRDALLAGEGAGQGMAAEMNGYPGPKHVLDLAAALSLNPEQKRQITAVYKEMSARAKELGTRIVRVEDELNTAFRQGLVSERSVKDDAEQIGRLRGRLRAVHLTAHLKTKELLSRQQLDLYKSMRAQDNKGQKH
jgi:Spy/CpxP family protein refolding chaperone